MSGTSKLSQSESDRISSRARGRPSRDVAAQIDQEVVQAARDLFLSLGYERTSMAMITRAAGISKTTLYSRYATKADLFIASVNFTVDSISTQILSRPEAESLDLKTGLRGFGRSAIYNSLDPLWSKYERLAYSEGVRFPELAGAITAHVDAAIDMVRDFIVTCVAREGGSVTNPQGVAAAFVLALRGFYVAELLRGGTSSDDEIDKYIEYLLDLTLAARAEW